MYPLEKGMRRRSIEWLAIAVFLLFINSSVASDVSGSSPRKLLRLVQEERAVNVPIFDDILGGVLSPKTRLNLRKWFKQEKSADEVLTLLKLDDGVEGLLSRRNMKGLKKYITWLNLKNPDGPPVTMVETLATKYGDDLVAKMLELGKRSKSSRAKKLAKTLQDEQYRVWNNKGQHPQQVFSILRLDDADTLPLGSTVLEAWVGYKVWHPSTKTTTFGAFRKAYGDRRLASYLYGASMVPQTKDVAKSMQEELFTFWIKKHIHPDDMFTRAFKINPEQVTPTEMKIKLLYDAFYYWAPKTINK
ncbi:hypothetical protein P3T76_007853 [Phytophthora citrophthora]|uniref:RxLR effector protein n=1 Tax=Phytophthora citrophthora TaxID=4793 RepID=A0AAD9GM81_9STRA|nr:hypothetical protein P3T76_007853 [Phytophthora citrophthora]